MIGSTTHVLTMTTLLPLAFALLASGAFAEEQQQREDHRH
jgi:hypothetical protein